MKRGDVVVAVAPGEQSKPRPAVVVQSDLFNEAHASVVVCPITSYLVDAPLFRVRTVPSPRSGLNVVSDVMVDKVMAIKREKVGATIGRLSKGEMAQVDAALRLWLELES